MHDPLTFGGDNEVGRMGDLELHSLHNGPTACMCPASLMHAGYSGIPPTVRCAPGTAWQHEPTACTPGVVAGVGGPHSPLERRPHHQQCAGPAHAWGQHTPCRCIGQGTMQLPVCVPCWPTALQQTAAGMGAWQGLAAQPAYTPRAEAQQAALLYCTQEASPLHPCKLSLLAAVRRPPPWPQPHTTPSHPPPPHPLAPPGAGGPDTDLLGAPTTLLPPAEPHSNGAPPAPAPGSMQHLLDPGGGLTCTGVMCSRAQSRL